MNPRTNDGQNDPRIANLLHLTNIAKSYYGSAGTTAVLHGVNFVARDREVIWLRGPSGSGKSSLLRIAGLLSSPDSGSVEIMGTEPSSLRAAHSVRRLHIGMVFQNGNLMPDLSVRDNVAIAAARADYGRVNGLLEEFGLAETADRMAKEISGGQAQRVAVCRALLNDPSLILADEPTAGLDAAQGMQVLQALAASRRPGRAIVIASHDERVSEIADRVVTIEDGRIV